MKEKPTLIALDLREADVEAVMKEYEADTGKPAHEMDGREFADRMMKKILATANVIEGGAA